MTPQQIEQMRVNSCRKGLTMYGEYVAGAMDASEWQRKHDIEKACEWLESANEGIKFLESIGIHGGGIDVEKFRKEMEEELC